MRLLLIGCELKHSTRAAYSRRACSSIPTASTAFTEVTSKTPSVSVPVLSNTTVFVFESVSRKFEPLTRIPCLLAPPIPAKKLSGMLTTRAHGQLMTRNVSAR